MKKYIILTSLLIGFLVSYGQDKKKPDIYFIKKTIDFGTIEEGTNPKIIFEFYNSGSAPLVLKNVKPDCGCTIPDWPRQPIMPGQSSKLVARFDSKGFANLKINKSISITTNVPDKNGMDKVFKINFKGYVKPKSN